MLPSEAVVMIDRSRFPNADDQYTPAQRRGRAYGPFDSHAAFVASLRSQSKKPRRKKSSRVA
jgi:hypothetical protein